MCYKVQILVFVYYLVEINIIICLSSFLTVSYYLTKLYKYISGSPIKTTGDFNIHFRMNKSNPVPK